MPDFGNSFIGPKGVRKIQFIHIKERCYYRKGFDIITLSLDDLQAGMYDENINKIKRESSSTMAIGSEQLREVMRNWTTGVTVVSSSYEGMMHGMTVSSFTSVSLDPPLVLVSLERGTRTHELVTQSGFFGVTILSEMQQEVSDRFAGRHTELLDRFAGLNTHTLVSGVPFLEGGLAFLDCKVVWNYEATTNTLFIGEVMEAQTHASNEPVRYPLLYYNRAYHKMCV